MNKVTQIDLLRHGELETPGLFCAKPDEPLSKKGLQNLLDATHKGKWDVIISSPQERCQSFAKILAEKKECELLIDPSFKEMDFGDWVGVTTKSLWENHSEHLKQLWESPETFVAPSGESMTAFIQRIKQAWQVLLEQHTNCNILLITHAGVIRSILADTLNISHQSTQRFNIEYAHLSQLHYYPDGIYSLRSHGIAHCS